MLKAAVKNRYLISNPAADVALPRVRKREMLFLDEHEIERLVTAVPPRYRSLIYVLAYGGMRWGEAAALRRSRVNVLHGRIEVAESLAAVGGKMHFGSTKNHRNRTITLPRFLRDSLNSHLVTYCEPGHNALVYTATNGAPLRNSNFTRNTWRPALITAGLRAELRIHDLRHTAPALMIAEGAHPEKMKRHLGHSSITVTMDVHGHLFPAEDEAIADRLHERRVRALADNTRTKH